jgi:hypothetical protein
MCLYVIVWFELQQSDFFHAICVFFLDWNLRCAWKQSLRIAAFIARGCSISCPHHRSGLRTFTRYSVSPVAIEEYLCIPLLDRHAHEFGLTVSAIHTRVLMVHITSPFSLGSQISTPLVEKFKYKKWTFLFLDFPTNISLLFMLKTVLCFYFMSGKFHF